MKNKYIIYNTRGMVIATITIIYSFCAFFIAIATLLSCFMDPTFLSFIVSIVSFTIAIITFIIACIAYKYHGGYIALGTSHFVIKTASKNKKSTILWTDLANVTIDKSRTLYLLLKDGTSYQLKHLVNLDELLICVRKHM